MSRGAAKRILAAWIAGIAGLAVVGAGVEERLTDTGLALPGTESFEARELQKRSFGGSVPAAVLLEGPASAVSRQGRRLARELARSPEARVLSPWSGGELERTLRPRPDRAMVLADYGTSEERSLDYVVPTVERAVDATVRAPVRARTTGLAFIAAGIKDASVESTRKAEMIAFPVLLVVLLLVFRSPVAAGLPLALGAATVTGAKGLVAIMATWTEIDSIVVPIASMMGLALGVDYALLVVSRFREELQGSADAEAAVVTATRTAGRTILFAGAVLLGSMGTALLIAPGGLFRSVALGVVFATVVGVLAARTALPALLTLLGRHVDRWSLPRRRRRRGPGWLARRSLARPAGVATVVLAVLLLLAAPTIALETGPIDVRQLPADNVVRQDFDEFRSAMGPGWAAPYEVVIASRRQPVTETSTLAAVARLEKRAGRDGAVATVVGPGALAKRARGFERMPRRIDRAREALASGRRQLPKLRRRLGDAADGATQLADGLRAAAAGSRRLAGGAGEARSGAVQLSEGLAKASAGGARLGGGIEAAAGGSDTLARGLSKARSGAARLRRGARAARTAVRDRLLPGVERLLRGLRQGRRLAELASPASEAEASLSAALDELEAMTVGKSDPRYLAAVQEVGRAYGAVSGRDPLTGARLRADYDGLPAEITSAAQRLEVAIRGVERLRAGGQRLARGLRRLEHGADRLAGGAARLQRGGARLASGLDRLRAGGARLSQGLAVLDASSGRFAAGLTRLEDGAGRLTSGLDEGARKSRPLATGLDRGAARLSESPVNRLTGFNRELERLRSRTPGLFESGYFTLAAIDGARRQDRQRASSGIDVKRGGQAARVVIIPRTGPNDPKTRALGERLIPTAQRLARRTGSDVAVGGQAGLLRDYQRVTASRLPLLMAALAVTAFLLLVPILRAIVLPLVAVALNLVTVAAAFGILVLLFQWPGAGLGGPGYVDVVSAAAIFTIVFGLSIDYQVFLLTRMREGWVSTNDPDRAIEYGLERTARVVTGAAVIMTAVFVTFATADLANIRQLGIGLAFAVIVDATVVRLMLLPALMRMLGERTWWLPGWLDRRLPNLDVEPAQGGAPPREHAAGGARVLKFTRGG